MHIFCSSFSCCVKESNTGYELPVAYSSTASCSSAALRTGCCCCCRAMRSRMQSKVQVHVELIFFHARVGFELLLRFSVSCCLFLSFCVEHTYFVVTFVGDYEAMRRPRAKETGRRAVAMTRPSHGEHPGCNIVVCRRRPLWRKPKKKKNTHTDKGSCPPVVLRR